MFFGNLFEYFFQKENRNSLAKSVKQTLNIKKVSKTHWIIVTLKKINK